MPFNDGCEAALHTHIKALPPSILKNNPSALLTEIDDYTATKTPMITFKQPKVDIARQYLSKLTPQPKVLVELGGYVGKSAIAWGDMFRSFHPDGSAKVFSCELEEKFVGIITDFIDIAGLQGTVKVLQGPSGESLRSLRQKEGVDFIDVLFLDHWEECYLPDLKTCEELRLLRVGSVVLADNVDMPGAPEYLKYVEGDGEGGWKYRCETMLVDGPENIPRAVHFAYVEATP